MIRSQLEHIIRAAAAVADDDHIVVFGSQAILGQFPDAPDALLRSMEADVFPRTHPERWELIDGSLGEESPFHRAFGYYAQGVEERTAVLPRGWRDRLIAVRTPATRGATGWALEAHDLLIAKLAAGRPKDIEFADIAVGHGLASRDTLVERLAETELDEGPRARIAALVRALPGP